MSEYGLRMLHVSGHELLDKQLTRYTAGLGKGLLELGAVMDHPGPAACRPDICL